MTGSRFDLTGAVALVTGGAGRIGRSICEALGEAGAHVIVASRNAEHCETAARELRDLGHKAAGDTFDQADEQSILHLRDRLLKTYGAIHIVVNNSVARPMASYHDSLDQWRASMDVNATGVFALSRAFLDAMKGQRDASIINISSIHGVVAPSFENYVGTDMTTPPDYHFHKHGLIGLTKYLAAVGGRHGVRVNAISLGGFENDRLPANFREAYLRRVFLGRMSQNDDVKGAVVFLASRASAYVTGQNLIVDGGYTC